jgi:hypothetical protein
MPPSVLAVVMGGALPTAAPELLALSVCVICMNCHFQVHAALKSPLVCSPQELAATAERDAEQAQREGAAMLAELERWRESEEGAKWQQERARPVVLAGPHSTVLPWPCIAAELQQLCAGMPCLF